MRDFDSFTGHLKLLW